MGYEKSRLRKTKDAITESVRLVFGPHYFVQLKLEDLGAVTFVLGATHHGFKADASQVNGELEKRIYEVRGNHAANLVD